MPRIEPGLVPVVTDLERGLRELGVRFGLVGALVPELLLAVRPPRKTNDVDVVAVVVTIPDFEAVKERLGAFGFTRTSAPYQLKHRDGCRWSSSLRPMSPRTGSMTSFQITSAATT